MRFADVRRCGWHSTRRLSLPQHIPTYILGISAFYHDSAACLLRDGEIVAAAQEERFTRKKGDAAFPRTPSSYCLATAGITRERPRRTSASTTSRCSSSSGFSRPTSASRRAASRRFSRPARSGSRKSSSPIAQLRDGARRLRGRAPLRRASRVARGERVLPVAVRGGRDPDDGRRRRVGDRVDRRRPRQRPRAPQRAALARFARPALLGLHLLHRLQGQLRRVQGHGPRARTASRSTST